MKKNKKILAILVAGALTALCAQAQIQPSDNSGALAAPVNVGQGNTYEKEVTPLLRDISKKKSLLELRKLDRELEKLEEETLTAQMERDKALNPPAPLNVTPGPGYGQGLPSMPPAFSSSGSSSSSSSEEDAIRVLMVYGFDNDLYAKVSSGSQGGYVVRKGDVLPDGRLITNITPNFLEVKKAAKSKGGSSQKLYVSGPAPIKTAGNPSSATPNTPSSAPGINFLPPVSGAANAANAAVPMGSGIMLQLPGNVTK